MKFSVLLPTRNRLDYLKFAIDSVRKQDYDNWEIIVSDNASEEDIGGYVRSLNESRIKYMRTEEFLTVTQNWNRCLNEYTGDYVIMLGDDDILLNDYFNITKKLIESYERPDVIYSNAFLFAYPGVIPESPKGLFHTFGSLNAMPQSDKPYWFDHASRVSIIKETLNFVPIYGTNMQHVLIRREMIEKNRRDGEFFHSPYPDLYAMSALFLEAERLLVYPKELVVIGITPKSHGYYFFNNKEKEGVEFLNIQKEVDSIPNIQSILLPVSGGMLTFWLAAIEKLHHYFPLGKYHLKLDYNKYRKGQIDRLLNQYIGNPEKFEGDFQHVMKYLTLFEKMRYVYPRIYGPKIKRKIPSRIKWFYHEINKLRKTEKVIAPACSLDSKTEENKFQNAGEVFENVIAIDCVPT